MKLIKAIAIGAAVLMAPLFASNAQAAFIDCTPLNNSAISDFTNLSPVLFNCPAYDAPGSDLITQVSLQLFITFQDTDNDNGTHQVQGDATEDSTQFFGSTTSITNSDAAIGAGRTPGYPGGFLGSFSSVSASSGLSLLVVNPFTMSVAVSIPATFTSPANATISAGYLTAEIPGTAVPEPASMLLLGTGLAGLAAKARRRRAAKK